MMYTVNATINGIEVPVEVSAENIKAVGFVHSSEVPCIEDETQKAYVSGRNSAKEDVLRHSINAVMSDEKFTKYGRNIKDFEVEIDYRGLLDVWESFLKRFSNNESIERLLDTNYIESELSDWIEENMKEEKYFEVEIALKKTVVYTSTVNVAVKAKDEDEAQRIVENCDVFNIGDRVDYVAEWYEDDWDFEIDDVCVNDECDECDYIVIE